MTIIPIIESQGSREGMTPVELIAFVQAGTGPEGLNAKLLTVDKSNRVDTLSLQQYINITNGTTAMPLGKRLRVIDDAGRLTTSSLFPLNPNPILDPPAANPLTTRTDTAVGDTLAMVQTWLGSKPDHFHIFADGADWPTAITGVQTQLWGLAAGGVFPFRWSLQLCVVGETLTQVAGGSADANFRTMGQMISESTTEQEISIRLGWEMNGNWFPWSALAGEAANFVSAWQRIVTLLRGIDSRFKFSWCVSNGQADPTTMYPGNTYVDRIGVDVYQFSSEGTEPYASWLNAMTVFGTNLTFMRDFAATQGKQLVIDEWGINTDNMEYYVGEMARYIWVNGLDWHGYWDKNAAAQFQDKLSNNQYPGTGAQFLREFGILTNTTPGTYRASQTASTYIPLTASKRFVSWSIVSPFQKGFYITGSTLLVTRDATLGVHEVTVRATDGRGQVADKIISVNVQAAALSAWTPAAAKSATLVLWLDIADAATITASGGFASAVADKSAGGHNATQGTGAAQPAYSLTGHNSLPALTFDGIDDMMSFGAPISNLTAGATVALMMYGDPALVIDKTVLGLSNDSSQHVIRLDSGSGAILSPAIAFVKQPTAIAWPGQDLVTVWNISATASSRNLSEIRTNGTELSPYSFATSTNTVTQCRLGARPLTTGGSNWWPGVIQEVVMYSTQLSAAETFMLEGYLAWHWGKQSLLPSGHPYKNAAPLAL